MRFYWLVVVALTVWRITHLLQAEDGPWDLVVRLRRKANDTFWGRLLDCFYCLSLWVALPFALGLGEDWKERLLLWPALSAAASLLPRRTWKTRRKTMSCCGGRRVQATQSTAARPPSNPAPKAIRYSHAFFRYVGTTGLTVVGAATGTRYRFDSPGAI